MSPFPLNGDIFTEDTAGLDSGVVAATAEGGAGSDEELRAAGEAGFCRAKKESHLNFIS